jgi:hypothetical protein
MSMSITLPDEVLGQLSGVTLEELSEVVSRQTWEEVLGAADREALSRLLPFSTDKPERARALACLFAMEPIKFVSPIELTWTLLRDGQLTAEAAAERARLQHAHAQFLAQHHDALVTQLHARRKTWLPPQPKPPKQEKRLKGKSEDWLVYSKESGGLVRRNQKQPGAAAAAPVGRPAPRQDQIPGAAAAIPGGATPWGLNPHALNPRAGALPGGVPVPMSHPGAPALSSVPLGVFRSLSALTPSSLASGGGSCGGGGSSAAGGVVGAGDEELELAPEIASHAGEDEAELASNYSDMDEGVTADGVNDGGVNGGSDGRKRPRPSSASSDTGAPPSPGSVDYPDGFSPELQFFRLVRDAIASVPQALAPAEYVRKQVKAGAILIFAVRGSPAHKLA